MNSLYDQTRRRKAKARVFSTLLLLFGSGMLAVCQPPGPRADDPNLLQSRAIQNIDSSRTYWYRTGNTALLLPALRSAQDDLEVSYQAFIAKGDSAAAAWSLVNIADIERMTDLFSATHQESVANKYRKAIELAKQANRADYQFKALAGLALTESNRGDLASASQHASQALDLAVASGNKSFQLRALDDLSDIEVKRQNFDAARGYLERAQTVATGVPNSYEHYIHQMDAGDFYYKLALRCDSLSKPQECSKLFDQARSAYEAGGAVARSLQYDYMAGVAKSFLRELDLQQPLNAQQFAYNARISQDKGNTEVAESSLRQVIAIQEKSPKPDDSAFVDSLVALADLLVTSNKTEEALRLYNRALQITRKDQESHREVQILSSLSQVYFNLAKYNEAIDYLQAASVILRKLDDIGALATTLSNLGSVYVAEGRYSEASEYFQRSLLIRTDLFGAKSAVTANSLTDLAGLYYHMGQYSKAQSYYEAALAVLEGTLGKDQTEVATVMNNLGLVYQALGKSVEAEAFLSNALDIRVRVLGAEHPETAATINNLASLDVSLGKYDAAYEMFKRAFEIDSKVLGPDHPTTKTIADNLVEVANMQKKERPAAKKQN